MAEILMEVRRGARTVWRDPRHALLVVLILGLGLGVTIALYSVISGVLLRPLPFADPERLVDVRQVDPEEGWLHGVSGPTFEDWAGEAGSLRSLAAYSPGTSILGSVSEPVRVRRTDVTGAFFQVLGLRSHLGRLLLPGDSDPAAPAVAVLGHALWMAAFGGDPGAVGRVVTLDGTPHEVVGVAPERVSFPEATGAWTAIPTGADYMAVREAHILGVVARLEDGASAGQAEAELTAIVERIPDYAFAARVQPLAERLTGDVRAPLLVLMAAVAAVLLVACANAGNLLLARAVRRRHELAIRNALGASGQRLAGYLLGEALTLSLAAGALGVVTASWLTDTLLRLAPGDLPRASEVGLHPPVLLFALAVSIGVALLTGLAPMLRAARVDAGAELRRSGPRATAGGRMRAALVVAEVALSVVLLAGGGLLLKSFHNLTSVDPGFRTDRVTTFDFSLPAYRYADSRQYLGYERELLERVRALPGVSGAAISQNLPLSGRNMMTPALVEGRELRDAPRVQISAVSDGYFAALGTPVTAGREFAPTDDEGAPPVAIVNEAFVRAYFGGESPLGRRARTFFGEPVMREIVGVVANQSHGSLAEPPPPMFYYPLPQLPPSSGRVVVRSAGSVETLVPAVRAVARRLDREVPLGEVATMRELVDRTIALPRFYAAALGGFAGLALLLALSGFYAVLSQTVTLRRREIGIRMAVGARSDQVVALVAREAAGLTGAGLALGLGGALAATRLLRSQLFGVDSADPWVLAGVVATLLVVAAAAAWLPARRAVGYDPVAVLRTE